ncbi:hypothetical protein OCK74_03535 [Chitinophagaceae bacterium LB-8]|uniref:BT4734-like N-terminal domain-containing protein n=1 Tax=Paraflavisolibacter caeni TaxID=2982496 RepID=A0A9X3BGQ3_9BACT|nr:BT4734/BF3469 family protein [Paraflavisolibacter caeni]MCU7548167.1 hypothetical protein [Paraflavisolibacter caeni]
MEQNKDIIITRKDILDLTYYGMKVYAHILHHYYPKDETVLVLKGKKCKPAKNPFNGDEHTLMVYLRKDMAMHYDTAVQSFAGNVFAFAAQHYQLKGAALLERIDEDMELGIGKKQVERQTKKANGQKLQHPQLPQNPQIPISSLTHFCHHPQNPTDMKSRKVYKVRSPQFSYFRKPIQNTVPLGYGSLVDIYKVITSTQFENVTQKLRAITDKEKARKFKEKNFDYVTFSGIFSSRENNALVIHSGLFTVDFDHVPDVEGLKRLLLKDPYFVTEMLFVSPSGDGLKWIIPINTNKTSHQEWAQSIGAYLFKTYGLKMDPSGKDVARACFLPYDPNAYINPKYLH